MNNRGWMVSTLLLMAIIGGTIAYGAYVYRESNASFNDPSAASTIPIDVDEQESLLASTITNQRASEEHTPTPISGTQGNTIVIVTHRGVRLRSAPSIDAPVVGQFSTGHELMVTGPSQENNGIVWLPVIDPLNEAQSGYIATQYVTPKE